MIDIDTFTKMPKNVRNLGKLIVAEGFKKLPKALEIVQSGHTGDHQFRFLLKMAHFKKTTINLGVRQITDCICPKVSCCFYEVTKQ